MSGSLAWIGSTTAAVGSGAIRMVVLKNFPAHPTGSPASRFVPGSLTDAFGSFDSTAVPDARDLASGLRALFRWTISVASTRSAV